MKFLKAFAAATLLTAAACTTTAQNTPASIAEEQAASRQLLAKMRAEDAIIEDRALNAYVDSVVSRIDAQRPAGAVPLQTFILREADINAFTTGGGYLFINAGLLAAMENEAQFAMVVAHEIAHIDRGHVSASRANRQNAALAGALAQIGAAALGVGGALTDTAIGLGQNATISSYSRSQESDADATGFEYDARAGYNMVEAARSFEVLNRVYGSRGGLAADFFASHPQSADRQANLTRLAQARGDTEGRVAANAYAAATRQIRREMLAYLERAGRSNEAAQIRRNLRG